MARSRHRDPSEQSNELARLRKQKNRTRLLGRLGALALICLVVWAVYFLRNDIQRLSLGMRMGDLLASYAPGGDFPQELPVGKIRDLAPIGKDLVVLTDSNLSIYNSQGKCTGSYLHGYGNAICRTNGDRVLTFDRGEKRFRVDSRSKELYSRTLSYAIVAADISRQGQVAVASGSERYKSQITVYDQEFDEIFIRSTADLVVDVVLDNSGAGMAVSSVDAESGMLVSHVTLLSFSQSEPVARATLEDELVLSMAYTEDGSLQVVTDHRAVLLGADGAERAEWDFGGAHVNRFVNCAEGGMFLLLDELGDGNNLYLTALDAALVSLGDTPVDEKVLSMGYSGGWIYLTTRSGVTAWDNQLENRRTPDMPELYQTQPAGNFLYGITSDSIVMQKQEPPPKKIKTESGAV